jgi:hypothetical protein
VRLVLDLDTVGFNARHESSVLLVFSLPRPARRPI